MASIEKLSAEELDRFEDELDKRKPALDAKLYEASAAKLRERREFLQKEELSKLCGDISKLDIKQLGEIKEKISEGDYIPEVTFPYIKKIDDAITNLQVQYYTKLTENINSMSRADLIVLLEKVNKNENHASADMLQRYIGKINSKIREADAKLLEKKCGNLGNAGEHRCFELIKDINAMDIDADTKKRFINQVELHITNLKTVERDGYVSLLKNLMDENSIKESQFYIPGISKSFDSIYIKIQNTYARTEQFEMPVVAHEFTPGHPEDSYLLTTEYLYGMGKTSGLLHIPVDQIEKFEGKGGIFGGSLKVVERNGKATDLPANIEKKLFEATAKVLNGVLAAVQKTKTDAKLKEAEEIKAAEEARLMELEQERKDIDEARKRAEEAEKAATAPKPAPVEKKEPVPEPKKIEPIKPIKPIEVVVSPIPEVKTIKPLEAGKPADAAKPAAPAPAKPVEAAKPAAPAPAKPVEAAKPAAPAPAKPAEAAKPKIKFCDQCGAKITSETAKFCAECGNRLIH